jgi:signal transduction histidine kinase
MSESINHVLNQLHGIIFEQNAKVTVYLEVDKISYPKVYLESILYNLLSNALKYIAKDKIPEIIVSTYTQDNRTILSVKDNGIGLDMNKYGNKIFKLNQVFHKGYDSKGIGLFITKTQVESLGGNIEVKSVLNEGSEFIVTF